MNPIGSSRPGTTIPLRSISLGECGTTSLCNPRSPTSPETAHLNRLGIPSSSTKLPSGTATRSSASGLTGHRSAFPTLRPLVKEINGQIGYRFSSSLPTPYVGSLNVDVVAEDQQGMTKIRNRDQIPTLSGHSNPPITTSTFPH